MTQYVKKRPHTVHFVRLKDALQDIMRAGLDYYKRVGIIDWSVKVLKADPTGPSDLPAVCINRTSDREVNQVLGDAFGNDFDRENNRVLAKWGTNFRETIELRAWTQNSDQRDILYAIIKAILFEYRPYLALQYGVVNQNIVGGRDEASHAQYKGHTLYWGVVIFEAELSMQRTEFMEVVTDVDAELVAYTTNPFAREKEDQTVKTEYNGTVFKFEV